MKNVLKWAAIILGILIVLALVASPFLLRSGYANMAMHPGFNGWDRMGGHPGPRMMGGGFGLLGGMGLLFGRSLGQIVLLGLVIVGVVALVKYFKPQIAQPAQVQAQPFQPTVLTPVPAPDQTLACKACGKPLQADWAHCPYCGATI
jgi:hypothetical protein